MRQSRRNFRPLEDFSSRLFSGRIICVVILLMLLEIRRTRAGCLGPPVMHIAQLLRAARNFDRMHHALNNIPNAAKMTTEALLAGGHVLLRRWG